MTRPDKINTRYFQVPRRRPTGRYVQLGPIRMYYETYGRGKPLLLLHGGLSAIEGLRYQIPFFSKYFEVILPERPGHGRTADISGLYTYEQMALQLAHFMDALRLRKARLMGHSDGANLLFWLASKRRDLVDRFISVGGNFNHTGCEPQFQKALRKQKVELDPR
ncbi:MAG: alpha/beta hydrolase, partial [Candidatus Omnitrophica bacterium]|nr:alpha/beta hydrolase [Candidatus Omnitrophota bacterium]